MDLGVVLPIANGAQVMSTASPHPLPAFDLQRDIAVRAERLGFEYALAQVTLRGFGGETKHWDYQIESLPLMAGLGVATERIRLIGSVAMPTIHPAMAARMCSSIADISGGRFDLNLVTGWSAAQYSQMGLWPGDHYFKERYDYAEEYATVLKELWSTGRSSFKGKHYELEDCQLGADSAPVGLICAGQSERGLNFVAEYGDYAYVLGAGGADGIRDVVANFRALADERGRDVKALTVVHCMLGDTDEEAQAKIERYVEHADRAAIANMQGQAALDLDGSTAARILDLDNSTFQNIERAVGSPATVAAYLDEMATVDGLSGVMIIFDDSIDGLDTFGREVLPLMTSRPSSTATAA